MSLQQAIEQERARIQKQIEELEGQQSALARQLGDLMRELKAIDAYEAARSGATKPKQSRERTARGDSLPSQILKLLTDNSAGLNRASIIEKLGMVDDKKKQAAISPTLATMKKNGKIKLDGGLYTLA